MTQDAAVEDLADQIRACRTQADADRVVLAWISEAFADRDWTREVVEGLEYEQREALATAAGNLHWAAVEATGRHHWKNEGNPR